MMLHELVEQSEDILVKIRNALAFSIREANRKKMCGAAEMYGAALRDIERALYQVGWVRVGLEDHAPWVDMNKVPDYEAEEAYNSWLERDKIRQAE